MKAKALSFSIVVLLLVVTLFGVFSFNTENSYEVLNQYGDTVKMWGSGIYIHDSYFKAPIFIGTDFVMLFVGIPIFAIALFKNIKKRTIKTELFLLSILGLVLYYSTSIVFGATYNSLHLVYIALFACSLFAFIAGASGVKRSESNFKLTKGLAAFLIISGISLFVAWLPDIIPTIFNGKSLSLIEVYTTEITYILDMGIISPVMFICLYMLKKNNFFGIVLLSVILTICTFVGIMVISQSFFQILAGIDVSIAALITKVGIFVVLSVFSTYFNIKLYKN